MSEQDWDLVYNVHLKGAFKTTHAAWEYMKKQKFGRIIFTSSAAGLFGNFGQANYSAAKMALVGFSKTLAFEGKKYNIHVNTIAPLAYSRILQTVAKNDIMKALKPEYIAPLVLYLCHEKCTETGGIFEVGAGWIGKLRWQRTRGVAMDPKVLSPETIEQEWKKIVDFSDATYPTTIQDSMKPVVMQLMKHGGMKSKL